MYAKTIGLLSSLVAVGAAAPFFGLQNAPFSGSHTTDASLFVIPGGEACLRHCSPVKPDFCPLGSTVKELYSGCYTCCAPITEDLTALSLTNGPPCWDICGGDTLRCPLNMHRERFAHCDTCCYGKVTLGPDEDYIYTMDVAVVQTEPTEACLMHCLATKPPCIKPSYAKKVGDSGCWTCCMSVDEDKEVASKQVATTQAANDICLLLCGPKGLNCPSNFHPKQFDQCWTCCRNIGDENVFFAAEINGFVGDANAFVALKGDIVAKNEVSLIVASSQEVCWRACFPEEASCPGGGFSKQFGHCYTCCFKPTDEVVSVQTTKKADPNCCRLILPCCFEDRNNNTNNDPYNITPMKKDAKDLASLLETEHLSASEL